MDAANSCLDLVALLKQNKVSQLRLMVISIVSEDTAKSCLDLVALLRQNKMSQLRLMATSMNTAKSCHDLVALLRQNKVTNIHPWRPPWVLRTRQDLPRPRIIAQTDQGEQIEAYDDL